MAISIQRQIECIERELKMRRRVFPRLVNSGKMTESGAEDEILTMEAVKESLSKLSVTQGESLL